MGSRVCDIKKKFEGLCEAPKLPNKIECRPTSAKVNNSKNLEYTARKHSEIGNNCSSVSTKGNIKRSHAFRLEKGSRNICQSDSSGSLITAKSENSMPSSKTNDKKCLLNKDSHVIFLNKMLSSQDSLNNKKISTSSDVHSEGNVLLSEVDTNIIDRTKKDNLVAKYAVVLKSSSEPIKKSFINTRPDSLQLNNGVSKLNSSEMQSSKKLSKVVLQPILPSGSNKTNFKCNRRPELETVQGNSDLRTPVKRENEGYIEDGTLSNTLQKVLKSPLPSGPPPRKPPRTFAHTTDWPIDNLSLCNDGRKIEGLTSDDINLQIEKLDGSKPNIKPTRSKTESQIMLKKLEIALLNHHQQGKVLEPKTDWRKSPKDALSTSTSEHSANSTNHLDVVRKSSLPDTPSSEKHTSDSGCFGVLSCSNSMDLVKSSHIYDIPFEPKSHFYIDNFKDVNLVDSPSESSSLISKENCTSDNRLVRYGKVQPSSIQEPIYAKPQTRNTLKNLKFEEKPELSSVSQMIKSINSSGKLDKRLFSNGCSADKFKHAPVLHYMSSPILEKVPLLQSPAPSLPEKSVSNQRKFFENNSTKSFPGRSFSLDLESTSSKNVCSRSLSVDLLRAGDKDFHIDNEKIQMMVNEVYNKCLTMPQDSDSESVASTPDESTPKPLPGKHTTSPEEAQKERQQRTAERKTYLKRVCSRTKSFHRPSENFPHLFEYMLLIGLDLNPARCKVPYIKAKYPEDAVVPRGIEQLCFPDATDWPPQACADESGVGSCYCIIITHASGTRKYGYCRRVQPEGAPICLPLAYCIVSPYKANCYFGQVLAELESRHGQPDQTLSSFIHQLYQCPFPAPGKGLLVTNPSTNDKMEILSRKLDPRQEEIDIARLLNLVRFSVFLQLFVTLLLERKVILLSYSISKLSTCIEGLCASLYPFHWQHTLVPIVPSTMFDLCQAPTPYVIGMLKPHETGASLSPASFSNIDQVLVVDIDESRVLQSCGDENTVLPPRLCRGLREALHCAIPEKNASLSPAHNLIASEALIALFVQLVGHYRDHIITSSATGQRDFQRDGFVKSVASNTVQSFLDWFSETTMFTAFIESRLDRSIDPWGLFEQRCVEHLAQHQTKSYRSNINKTVKSFGDRFKEWTNSS